MARLALDGVPVHLLARRWRAPHARVFDQLPSTLDTIHALGAAGAPAGTVVLAEEQTAGRGRDGRTWRSPLGGVWLGLLLRPTACTATPGAMALRVGLVVADVVDELLGEPATRLKWPNDVLLGDRKLGGILCEGRWQGDAMQWLAVGIGINVANAIPAELATRAVALAELGSEIRRIDVLDRLVPALLPLTTHHAPLSDVETAAFARRDWLRGRLLTGPVAGRAAGVQADGALVVETGTGPQMVREGHVELS